MKILTIIPAKQKSSEIPGKNFIPFAEHNLLYWTITQAIKSHYVWNGKNNEIVIITERYSMALPFIGYSDRIRYLFHHCEGSIEDSILSLQKEGEIELANYDYILLLQPTSPLRTIKDVDNVIQLAINSKGAINSIFSCTNVRDQCYWNFDKQSKSINPNYKYYQRETRQEYRKKDNILLHENGSIYLFKPYLLLDNNRISCSGRMPYIMEDWQDYEVDTKEDFDICEMLFENKLKTYYLL